MNRFQKTLAVVSLSLFSLSSHAALFDDSEARKKILEVESESVASDAEHETEIAALKKRVKVQSLGLQDMQDQIEQLKQDLALMRGDLEVANHSLQITEKRQKDLYADTDARIRKLEAVPSSSIDDGSGLNVDGEDGKAYAAAYGLTTSAKHKEAFDAYEVFLKDYPESNLVPNALYGLGYSQFALKNYQSSIATQQKLLDRHPDNTKAPDAMYSIANSQIQLGQIKSAKRTLSGLIAKHPDAAVTPNAKKRLKVLESFR
jgi:tol-pal system protein YbgF